MTREPMSGINGVLDSLLSPSPASTASSVPTEPAPVARPCVSAPNESDSSSCSGARLGRPPGRSHGKRVPKQKVTFRISCDLIATYRDWSWEARCQVSELVERALVAYRQSSLRRE